MEYRDGRGVSGVKNRPTSTSPVQNADASNPPPLIETPARSGPVADDLRCGRTIRPPQRKTRDGRPSVWIGRRGTLRCVAHPEEDWEYGRNLQKRWRGFHPTRRVCVGQENADPLRAQDNSLVRASGVLARHYTSCGLGKSTSPPSKSSKSRWQRASRPPAMDARPGGGSIERGTPAACARSDCSAYAVAPLRSLPATAKMRSTTPRRTP